MLCLINDRFVPYNEAHLHVSDIGLQRGYGIFDYFLAVHGSIPFFEDYLDRFFYSAKMLNLDFQLSREELKEKIRYLIQQNQPERSGIKLLLTGGYSEDLYTPTGQNLLILNLPMSHHPGDLIGGIKLMLLDYIRFRPEIKTTFYLPTLSMMPELRKQGATEVLYHNNGAVSETTRANIFIIKQGKLITPSEGILKGVTRMH
ncbi:MAG: aminotransferase class IV, partial [Bacteroidales bacterium]|nr:aminotransferase class IV [Bacteroidales bacterium]